MKTSFLKTTIILFMAAAIVSCHKKDIPSSNLTFVGTWDSVGGENIEQIVINQDGTGSYNSIGIIQKEIKGYVKFDGDNFKISAFGIKKGFITYERPKKIITSQSPYTYHYEANFNEVKFIRE